MALSLRFSLLLPLGVALAGCSGLFPDANEKTSRVDQAPPPQETVVDNQPKRRILVLPFLNYTPYETEPLQQVLWNSLKDQLSNNPQLVLVSAQTLSQPLPSMVEAQTYDMTPIFRLARNQGIAGIVGGVIENIAVEEGGNQVGIFRNRQYSVNATVRIQLFDTRSETEIFNRAEVGKVTEELTTVFGSRSPTASDPDRVQSALGKVARQLAGELPPYLKRVEWVGRIAKIDLHRLYINAGELSGIRVGQLLKVYGEGTAVRDEPTGSFLGIAPGPFKGILKVVDYFGNDGAVAVVHSGAGFRERDRVEMIASPRN